MVMSWSTESAYCAVRRVDMLGLFILCCVVLFIAYTWND